LYAVYCESEFTLFTEEAFNPESLHLPVFIPWFLHEWTPDPVATIVPKPDLDAFPLGSEYLRRRGRYSDRLTIQYLESCRDSAFSFLDVVDVTPGSGCIMHDVLTGWEGEAIEKSGSQTLRKGDILFAKVVTVDEVTILDGCAPIAFPPLERAPIIDLRKRMRKAHRLVTPDVLRDYRLELLEIYHSTAERLLNPTRPVLQNTDGDPLVFCRITYEVPSARAAFDAIRHLCLKTSEVELLANARFDNRGELVAVEVPWLREGNAKLAWDNTILGHLRIEGQRLVAEVNSSERAKTFRAIAHGLLPAGSRHLSTVVESVEAALEAARKVHSEEPAEDDLNELPEARAARREYLRAHYRDWPDMKLPALNGRTPRQAMKTADGREMVVALLLDLERRRDGSFGVDDEILAELRASLGVGSGVRKSLSAIPRGR